MTTGGFRFSSGNLAKLLALPQYVLSLVLSWFVPRDSRSWAFGSGVGVGEGALAVAKHLRDTDPEAQIHWLVADEREADAARDAGFIPVLRGSWAGYWTTLRAGCIVVTHGLGDVNRFGVFGGFVVQLWHGAPLKRLHLDSSVTTAVRGPAPVRALLRKMYLAGAGEVDLYVAGSPTAATRLRSAFRVLPGNVRVLGDPRDDALARQAADSQLAQSAREALVAGLGDTPPNIASDARVVLYAPTWRDGADDPAVPSASEVDAIRIALERIDAHLVVRPHPLGRGAYAGLVGERIHLLDPASVRDVTPLLGGVDVVITDYSSIAVDFSLMSRPIIWFAPDLNDYVGTRGLYEPLQVTSRGRVEQSWADVITRLVEIATDPVALRTAQADARDLARRFHTFREGSAAARVVAEIGRLRSPVRDRIDANAVFFESFYGRQVSCNPLAIDREIAQRHPEITRYWSVTSELQQVPDGAHPVLVGGADWFAARRYARLLVVNDWLRYRFRRGRDQTVLQTWHGTMLKHLALSRPHVGWRTRVAIHRESRRWSMMLSQNPHSTQQFRESYAFRGEILESGYPRDDRLARSVLPGGELNPIEVGSARARLGVAAQVSVLAYVPTWRDGGLTLVDDLNVARLAEELGDDWTILVRGHTRTHEFGSYLASERVIDVSLHPDINDVMLAADIVVTDFSSVMFDATVARRPMLFFVPDLVAYRDRERGFTFDFEREAPGPLLTERAEVVRHAQQLRAEGAAAPWMVETSAAAERWRERFAPHDDGHAAARVVDALERRGALDLE